jgi:hypothetical protein
MARSFDVTASAASLRNTDFATAAMARQTVAIEFDDIDWQLRSKFVDHLVAVYFEVMDECPFDL